MVTELLVLLALVNRALQTALPISRESTTMAGLCMALALAVPPVGTRLEAGDGTVLEVVEAAPRRVRTVRLHRRPDLPPSNGDPGPGGCSSNPGMRSR